VNARLDQPSDAAGFARRGMASAARHDYEAAIRDLTQACELAPTEATLFYQRGMVHWHSRQADLALADFDQAIKLDPDGADARAARASLRALKMRPNTAAFLDSRGLVYLRQSNYDKAIAD
jgi:tetratricopeptide (TPR) repeat protein